MSHQWWVLKLLRFGGYSLSVPDHTALLTRAKSEAVITCDILSAQLMKALFGVLRQAVIRRMPRRLLVDLPDVINRAKIAKVRH